MHSPFEINVLINHAQGHFEFFCDLTAGNATLMKLPRQLYIALPVFG
ncbi:hypothetical protein FSI88_019910 [Escherichia coli]|nr:hypothetical protein [Escherichia coli]HCQ0623965.1 hypothetical protein [Escherichia coli]